MKLMLVNPPSSTDRSMLSMPLNLMILSNVAKKAESNVEILDLDFMVKTGLEKDWLDYAITRINSSKCDVIGITTNCLAYPAIFELAKKIKKNTANKILFLGGPQAGVCPEQTLRAYNDIDFIILGEGEKTLEELIKNNFNNLENISGLCFRKETEIINTPARELLEDMNLSPMPDYESIDIKKYVDEISKTQIPTIPIEIGRGCPYNCTFCTTSIFWSRRYRIKKIKRIVDEINHFKKYGVKKFSFVHDNLAVNKNYILELSEEMSKFQDVSWNMSSRIDNLDIETINTLALGGCKGIFFGIETGSQRLQKDTHKNLRLENIEEIIKKCTELNINTTCSFIIGFPDETKYELNETLNLALLCKTWGADIEIQTLSPLFGSEIYNQYKNKMYLDERLYDKSNVILENINAFSEIEKFQELYSYFYSIKNNYFSNDFLWFSLFFFRVILNNSPEELLILLKSGDKTIIEICEKFYNRNVFLNRKLSEKEYQFELIYKLHRLVREEV